MLFLLYQLLAVLVFSQSNTDSLWKVVKTSKVDSVQLQTLLDISWHQLYNNPDSAKQAAGQALILAKRINDPERIAASLKFRALAEMVSGNYYTAEKSLDSGIMMLESIPDIANNQYRHTYMTILNTLANVHGYLSNYDQAINYYRQATVFAVKLNKKSAESALLENIGSQYNNMGNFDKALEYYLKSLEINKKINTPTGLAHSYNNIGTVYFAKNDFEIALYYYRMAIDILHNAQDFSILLPVYVNMGHIYFKLDKFLLAQEYFEKGYEIAIKSNNLDGQLNYYLMMSQVKTSTRDYHAAIAFANIALEKATQAAAKRFVMLSYQQLTILYERMHQYKKAYDNHVLYKAMYDSIFNAESDKRIAELEKRFETEKKEKTIQLLKQKDAYNALRIKNNKTLLYSLIAVIVLIVMVFIILFVNYKQKQQNKQQLLMQESRIKLAEKDKQHTQKILSTMIETENRERKRFAEELHDGLGVMLSSTKLYLSALFDVRDDEQKFDKHSGEIRALIDESINNAREIANNIMPPVISENGLVNALKIFCDRINLSGKIRVVIQTFNTADHYPKEIEIAVFRIVTELVNNTVKHAQASEIKISVAATQQCLKVSYSDNGVGANIEDHAMGNNAGLGLKNIISRLSMIGGEYNLDSAPGKGFRAGLEIPLV